MKRRDMKLLLEERFERIALLETRIDTMDQLVEGYRAREQAIFETLNTAKENAAKILEQARAEGAQLRAEAEAEIAEAQNIRTNARTEAEALLTEAINTANTLQTEAERKGVELSATVKADAERMLRDAEIIKREYEEMVESFNAMLEQNASELEVTAARFAEFVKNRKIDRTEARLDGNAFYKSVGEMSDSNLPDASDDPSRLMQNIYRIQNRPLPEDRLETARETAPQADSAEARQQADEQIGDISGRTTEFFEGNGSRTQQQAAEEPYSEAAWVNETEESKTEPQAEFVQAFNGTYVKSDYSVHAECALTQEDAASAFDALVSGEDAATTAAIMIPESSASVAAGIATQPLEDAARAFDEYFDQTLEPSGKTAQDAVPQDQAQGPEGALPENAPAAPVTPDTAEAAVPEPYSAQAWSQSTLASEHEPQAEGALFVDTYTFAPEPAQAAAVEQYAPAVTEPVSASEAEHAFDDYLTQMYAFAPAAPIAPAAAKVATPEPYSAQAWSQGAFLSEHEPQAEGALFDEANAFAPESAPMNAAAASEATTSFEAAETVSASEAEHAFDDYLAQFNSSAPAAPIAPAADIATPEPYSAQAWSQGAFLSEQEPQAEGALFGEANAFAPESAPMNAAAVPEAKTSFEAAETVSASEAEHAFDDYLTQFNSSAPAAPAAPAADVATPEPYSAQAWSQGAFLSEQEPQAEGDSHLSAQEPIEDEDPDPTPAPRRYNDYGEIREWEPEHEPDIEDIPTVSRFMGQSGSSEEISLDDLLDEIIKAGD